MPAFVQALAVVPARAARTTTSAQGLRVTRVRLRDLSASDIAQWAELAESSSQPNPFWHPDFVLPAAMVLAPRNTVELVVAHSGEGWLGCLPVCHASRGPLHLLASFTNAYCFDGTPLIAGGCEEQVAEALVAHLEREVRGALWLPTLVDGPATTALIAALGESRNLEIAEERSWERSVLTEKGAGELASRLGKKARSELRRRRRRLADDLGAAPRCKPLDSGDAVLNECLRVEASGWKGKAGTALACDPHHAGFFRQVARAFDARGAFVAYGLLVGDRLAAFVTALSAGGQLFAFKRGYDEGLRRYAPGRLLDIDFADYFVRERPERLVDSCCGRGDDVMAGLWPERRGVRSLLVTRGWALRAATRVALPAYRGARRALAATCTRATGGARLLRSRLASGGARPGE